MVPGSVREAVPGMACWWLELAHPCMPWPCCLPSLFHHEAAGDGVGAGGERCHRLSISGPGPKASLWEGPSAWPEEDEASLAGPGDLTYISPPCAPHRQGRCALGTEGPLPSTWRVAG